MLAVNIQVKAIGVFKEMFGSRLLTVKLKGNATVKNVVQKLAGSKINDIWLNTLILVNGKDISVLNGLETIVSNGDEIVLLPVSHGG